MCGPARACLQTGRYATETGCFTNGRALPEDEHTVAQYLGRAGYETAYIGKWHLASNTRAGSNPGEDFHTRAVPPERRGGFEDHWLAADTLEFTSHGYEGYMYDGRGRRIDFEGYRVDRLTDFAMDYLRERAGGDRPFFLFLSYLEPHQQNDLDRFVGPIGSKQRFGDFTTPGDLEGVAGDWSRQLPDYLGCCCSLDENVSRLHAELERLGLADRTLLMYTSDHGCHFRTRNDEYKRSCHESSIRCAPDRERTRFFRRSDH